MDWQDFRVHQRLKLPSEDVEDIYSTISDIDGVRNSWQITGRLMPHTLDRLTRSVIVTSTGASNRIEGNRLTDVEVEQLYRNLRVKKIKTRDEQEIWHCCKKGEWLRGNTVLDEARLIDRNFNVSIA